MVRRSLIPALTHGIAGGLVGGILGVAVLPLWLAWPAAVLGTATVFLWFRRPTAVFDPWDQIVRLGRHRLRFDELGECHTIERRDTEKHQSRWAEGFGDAAMADSVVAVARAWFLEEAPAPAP